MNCHTQGIFSIMANEQLICREATGVEAVELLNDRICKWMNKCLESWIHSVWTVCVCVCIIKPTPVIFIPYTLSLYTRKKTA